LALGGNVGVKVTGWPNLDGFRLLDMVRFGGVDPTYMGLKTNEECTSEFADSMEVCVGAIAPETVTTAS